MSMAGERADMLVRPVLSRETIERDLAARVGAVRGLMARYDLGAIVALAAGAPSQAGWLHYLAAAELHDGNAAIVLEPDRPDPLIVVSCEEAAQTIRATSGMARVEAPKGPRPIVSRVVDIIRDLSGDRGRVGLLGGPLLSLHDHLTFARALPGVTPVDITGAANELRMIKSPVEIAMMEDMDKLLDQGLALFERLARPGRRACEVAGEVEGFLRSAGCVWGTSKYSFGEQPYLYPAPVERRLNEDEAMVYEFVYSGPTGYWYILSSLYSFHPLPHEVRQRLRATEEAILEVARVAVPGNTCADLRAASDRVFADHGFRVTGRHTVDCHPIGTDINDGPGDIAPGWSLRENMTLAIHPASLLEGGRGYFLCDVFAVRPGGAVPLSPRRRFYRCLDSPQRAS